MASCDGGLEVHEGMHVPVGLGELLRGDGKLLRHSRAIGRSC